MTSIQQIEHKWHLDWRRWMLALRHKTQIYAASTIWDSVFRISTVWDSTCLPHFHQCLPHFHPLRQCLPHFHRLRQCFHISTVWDVSSALPPSETVSSTFPLLRQCLPHQVTLFSFEEVHLLPLPVWHLCVVSCLLVQWFISCTCASTTRWTG